MPRQVHSGKPESGGAHTSRRHCTVKSCDVPTERVAVQSAKAPGGGVGLGLQAERAGGGTTPRRDGGCPVCPGSSYA